MRRYLLLGSLLAAAVALGCHKHCQRPEAPCCPPPGGGTLSVPTAPDGSAPPPVPPPGAIGAPTFPGR
jgi:hypothetical protein